jgi:hypothetical protein
MPICSRSNRFLTTHEPRTEQHCFHGHSQVCTCGQWLQNALSPPLVRIPGSFNVSHPSHFKSEQWRKHFRCFIHTILNHGPEALRIYHHWYGHNVIVRCHSENHSQHTTAFMRKTLCTKRAPLTSLSLLMTCPRISQLIMMNMIKQGEGTS